MNVRQFRERAEVNPCRSAFGLPAALLFSLLFSLSFVGCENFSLPVEFGKSNSETKPEPDVESAPGEIEVLVPPAEKIAADTQTESPRKDGGQEAGVPGFHFGGTESIATSTAPSNESSFRRSDTPAEPTPADDQVYSRRSAKAAAESSSSASSAMIDDSVFDPPEEMAFEPSSPNSRTAAAVPGARTSKSGVTTIQVFYGTDRKPSGSETPNDFFGASRGKLSVGFCDVSIPPNHRPGELESPSIWRLEFRENPQRHVMLRNIEPVKSGEFFAQLRGTVNASIKETNGTLTGGEVFIFVHGFNCSFKDAARRTAQIAYDLSFAGAPVMFSWPSNGSASLRSYRDDARSAEWCQEHVMDFVTAIAAHSQARRVHLIAHSMGNRVVAGALRRLAYNSDNQPRFNEVILTAPDIDAETFKLSIAPRITSMADRYTIYASSDDLALRTAARINSWGDPRLGQAGDDLMMFPGFPTIDVVDASDVDTSLFSTNHSYFAESATVLADLKRTLRGLAPDARGLSTVVKKTAWRIPQRVQKIAIDDPDERFE